MSLFNSIAGRLRQPVKKIGQQLPVSPTLNPMGAARPQNLSRIKNVSLLARSMAK